MKKIIILLSFLIGCFEVYGSEPYQRSVVQETKLVFEGPALQRQNTILTLQNAHYLKEKEQLVQQVEEYKTTTAMLKQECENRLQEGFLLSKGVEKEWVEKLFLRQMYQDLLRQRELDAIKRELDAINMRKFWKCMVWEKSQSELQLQTQNLNLLGRLKDVQLERDAKDKALAEAQKKLMFYRYLTGTCLLGVIGLLLFIHYQ